ncbi:rhodanese-like domain-containing protein [Nodosilinea sp. LEGE 07298]|uniref:rhodanese-like domain-containing protein n=1 Tax=Nodosilinea sp. LEGE 07298 TaxID=2777970 RepID=UPI00187E05D5|nr:rhodanese-like domain-containing protein [Nodosilinea sp. LEGE 07298]MBE9109221.1 rhodanese-like domain-containing protein [Nodosilinea sp. LEGE 07298]
MPIPSPLDQTVVNLSPTELVQLPNTPLLIDVRSGLEYRTGHAPGARNLSLPRLLLGLGIARWVLPPWFRDLPPDQPIAVVCLTAHRSPIAAQQLVKLGFTAIYNVTGGMVEWRRLGLAIAAKAQAG